MLTFNWIPSLTGATGSGPEDLKEKCQNEESSATSKNFPMEAENSKTACNENEAVSNEAVITEKGSAEGQEENGDHLPNTDQVEDRMNGSDNRKIAEVSSDANNKHGQIHQSIREKQQNAKHDWLLIDKTSQQTKEKYSTDERKNPDTDQSRLNNQQFIIDPYHHEGVATQTRKDSKQKNSGTPKKLKDSLMKQTKSLKIVEDPPASHGGLTGIQTAESREESMMGKEGAANRRSNTELFGLTKRTTKKRGVTISVETNNRTTTKKIHTILDGSNESKIENKEASHLPAGVSNINPSERPLSKKQKRSTKKASAKAKKNGKTTKSDNSGLKQIPSVYLETAKKGSNVSCFPTLFKRQKKAKQDSD